MSNRRKPVKRTRMPAYVVRHTKERAKIPKPPKLEPQKPEITEPPTYDPKTQQITWKGITISRSEALEFMRSIGRTPISRGRFPTESDFILNAYRAYGSSPNKQEQAKRQLDERAQRWKDNYLKALEGLRDMAQTSEEEDNWDAVYWKIQNMSTDEFLEMMEKYGEELGLVFVFSPPNAYAPAGFEISDSVREKWGA